MKLSDFWMPCCISVAVHMAILSLGRQYSDNNIVLANSNPAVSLNIVTTAIDRSSSPPVSHDASPEQPADPVYEQVNELPQVIPETIRATEPTDSRIEVAAVENLKPAEPIEQDLSPSRPTLFEESDTSVREEVPESEPVRLDLPKDPVDVPSTATLRDDPPLSVEDHINSSNPEIQNDKTGRAALARSEDAVDAVEEQGVQVSAMLVGPCKPKYPRYSRTHGEEGKVVLSVEVMADGKVGEIRIVRSSGYSRPDKAAVEALEKATFMPAKVGNKPVSSTTKVAFTFRLED